MWLAELSPATIISADSRQVYRGFDIGTAKPTREEQASVPHEGIDVADPMIRYSAAAWATAADEWIEASLARGRTPIVVGGTGLYLRALFEGLFEEPPLDSARRAELEAELANVTTTELRRWTEKLDPPRASLGRAQLLRSVEIALLTGRKLSDLHRERPRSPRWRPRYLVVDPGPALADRIARRIDDMLDHGWPDEVQRLMQSLPPDAPAWNSTGYDAIRRFVTGAATRAEARERVLIDTRQYAKRQRTWFRHQVPSDAVTRVDPLAADWTNVVRAWAAK
jgi:tRNA dimethylallyltransferase